MEQILRRQVLDEVLETADLFVDDTTDADGVTLREDYKGRGYVAPGFGVVLEGSRRTFRFMTALGLIGRDHDERADGDFDSDQALEMARAAETDNMGRYDTILYFPGWKLED